MSDYDDEELDKELNEASGLIGPASPAGLNMPANGLSFGDPADPEQGPKESFQTLLGDFAGNFNSEFSPLLVPMDGALSALDRSPDDLPVRKLLPDLRQLSEQAREVLQKVASQQACVLIFGPLKSGKSTFMNALCASYVSEVTSLPAYPCLVQVHNGQTPTYSTVSYDGVTKSYFSHDQLRQAVDSGYEALSSAIRQAEAQGRDFDPAGDMPNAIRQIDITLPLPILARSGASLIDTPGLYTKMKFSYDSLTKNFRDTASCAIFIVKTDNLFLEQVFDEFNELLGLFGRIFLVVNLDGAKKDLRPDGSLAASLEHDEPRRIVDAFRVLTMSQPLKNAADRDKLRIYPVDLLHAASRRIRKSMSGGVTSIAEAFDEPRGQANFDALLGDLAEYLDSSKYITEFIETILRGASELADRIAGSTDHPSMKELDGHIKIVRQEIDLLTTRSKAISRLKGLDWTSFGSATCQTLLKNNQTVGQQTREEAAKSFSAAIENWFNNEASLASLNSNDIAPILAKSGDSILQSAKKAMGDCAASANCGLDISAGITGDLEMCEIELPVLAGKAVEEITRVARMPDAQWRFEAADIPVRKKFWDWILFRSREKIRKIVFGQPDKNDRPIPPKVKSRRLGEQGRQAMTVLAEHKLGEIILSSLSAADKGFFEAYFHKFSGLLVESLATKDQQTARRLADLEKRLASAEESFNAINHIRDEAQSVIQSMHSLEDKYLRGSGTAGENRTWSAPASSAWAVPSGDGGIVRPESNESAGSWQIPPGDWPADDDDQAEEPPK